MGGRQANARARRGWDNQCTPRRHGNPKKGQKKVFDKMMLKLRPETFSKLWIQIKFSKLWLSLPQILVGACRGLWGSVHQLRDARGDREVGVLHPVLLCQAQFRCKTFANSKRRTWRGCEYHEPEYVSQYTVSGDYPQGTAPVSVYAYRPVPKDQYYYRPPPQYVAPPVVLDGRIRVASGSGSKNKLQQDVARTIHFSKKLAS